jgi:hypothetical protein
LQFWRPARDSNYPRNPRHVETNSATKRGRELYSREQGFFGKKQKISRAKTEITAELDFRYLAEERKQWELRAQAIDGIAGPGIYAMTERFQKDGLSNSANGDHRR